jgi:hypothetical protein
MIYGRLGELIADMNQDELRVMLRIAERLTMGRRQYGPLELAGDKRDWRAEGAEELLDGTVYFAIQSLKERP